MKKLLIRILYRLLFQLDAANFQHVTLPSDTIGLRHKLVGAHPTLRHLPLRLSKEFEHIEDPYIHRLLTYLNEAITEIYVINTKLHSDKLDRLLSSRFYL